MSEVNNRVTNEGDSPLIDLDRLARFKTNLDTELDIRSKAFVKSVNAVHPDAQGDVKITSVSYADNLTSDSTQNSEGEFVIRTSGGDASIADGDAFALRVLGNRIHVGQSDEVLNLSITHAPEASSEPITATIDRDTFVEYVTESGTIVLTYTSAWSANPSLYGVTVVGTPVSGDVITITYVKANRGTIFVTTPYMLKSTGWNLYNHNSGYAYLTKYSSDYNFYIDGNYTVLQYSATINGEKTSITVVDHVFTIPNDGYVWVTGGDSISTYIINQWSDWTEGSPNEFEPYSETTIDFSSVISSYFPNGLFRVSDVRDEINLNTSYAISKIERLVYNAENLATAESSGRPYEFDTNYIYLVKDNYDYYAISVVADYTASDHGNEFFVGTNIPAYLETMYGNNLKNKLERDVVTISNQALNDSQKVSIRNKIGAASQSDIESLDEKVDEKTKGIVKTVNAIHPDANGEVKVTKVAYADNLTSSNTQNSEGEFVIRTSGGDASISDGDAFVMRVYGNRVHEGYVPEELSMNVSMAPRVAPAPISATLNEEVFKAYVGEKGVYTLSYTNSWDKNPTLYGVTVTGTPLSGDAITILWIDDEGIDEISMEVIAPRVAPNPIEVIIDRDTFVGYVTESGITTLSFTTVWDKNPTLYGVTVTGTPVNGDVITIAYQKEERGTIKIANPTAMKSTGWNLYNHTAGYAYLCKYSTQYGFLIGGAYSTLQYSQTIDGAKSTITPVDGVFTIPTDGYVWVTGGNNTSTFIINQWSDWTDGPAGDFEAYSETTVDLSGIMSSYFPYGLCRVGVARDEINLNAAVAISKIDRMAYNAGNLAAAKASGRPYEYDTNYIYILKSSYESHAITLDGEYTASDHGNEFFVGNDVPTYLETMYGNNLKNKLERDVVTISQQTLTSSQQEQVRENIDVPSKSETATLTFVSTLEATKLAMSELDINEAHTFVMGADSSQFFTGYNKSCIGVINRITNNAVELIWSTNQSKSIGTTRYNPSTGMITNLNDVNGTINQLIAPNAGSHNSIYRGANLGSSVTAAQWAAIKAGTFDNLFIGDYWVINGVNWRIAACDYWLNTGAPTICTTHHAVIVPDSILVSSSINSTNITVGAYTGSDFYTGNNSNTGKADAIAIVNNAFGSGHILSHREQLSTVVEDGVVNGWNRFDSTVELMNETMVYGARAWGSPAKVYSETQHLEGNGFQIGVDNSQLPLFQHDHSKIGIGVAWWLRDVVYEGGGFADIDGYGITARHGASTVRGIRPVFGIYQE